ncbi:MAG: AAA family ATPase [Candidatus Altiarchaeales archaeon]|nr:AAA family ATPase [Candidatus Altiarchaeales archaeon]MBD3415917.1 AAA family ATPase [Candidatus Altiarchaeales archaeon]
MTFPYILPQKKMSGKLFDDELKDKGVFKDLGVLSPHYIPKDLPYRKQEIKQITRSLASIFLNVKPNNIFLYGKTGTGKTSVVKNITRELESTLADKSKNKNNARAAVAYMNCRLGYNSKYQVLLKIVEDDSLNREGLKDTPLEGVRGGKLSGRSPTELQQRMRATIESNAVHMIVVLDEVDMVKDVNELIYILTRMNDEIGEVEFDGKTCRGSISIIGISNKYSFKNDLDPRTKSTLCEEEIVFKPYNANQLKTILKHRVKMGFKKGSISESNIALIAAYAAQTNGDARYGLRLLQKAGEIAQNNKRKRVKKDDVKEAKARVEEDVINELITTLPEHQQIVLYSIADAIARGSQYKRLSDAPADVLFSGEVYENYERICKHLNRNPRTMRWFGEYLKELEMLGLVTLTLSGSGVRGTTTLIRLGGSPADIKKIVASSLGLH